MPSAIPPRSRRGPTASCDSCTGGEAAETSRNLTNLTNRTNRDGAVGGMRVTSVTPEVQLQPRRQAERPTEARVPDRRSSLEGSELQWKVNIGAFLVPVASDSLGRAFMALKALQLAPREPPVLHPQARCGSRTSKQLAWFIGSLKLLSSIIFFRPRQAAHFLPTA